jgi:hypothetical protein
MAWSVLHRIPFLPVHFCERIGRYLDTLGFSILDGWCFGGPLLFVLYAFLYPGFEASDDLVRGMNIKVFTLSLRVL